MNADLQDKGRAKAAKGAKEKALFIPLMKCYFEEFEAGSKKVEVRKFGARWNYETCWVGRAVVLSCGYGKKRRLKGKIVSVWVTTDLKDLPDLSAIYSGPVGEIILIEIKLDASPRLRASA